MSVCAFKSEQEFINHADEMLEAMEQRERDWMAEQYALEAIEDDIWNSAMAQAIDQGDY